MRRTPALTAEELERRTAFVRVTLPVRHGTREIREDFPLREADIWHAEIDPREGEIRHWPGTGANDLVLTVGDGGIYTLIGWDGRELARREGIPVPHGLIPGLDGEMVRLALWGHVIVNWPHHPDYSAFVEEVAGAMDDDEDGGGGAVVMPCTAVS